MPNKGDNIEKALNGLDEKVVPMVGDFVKRRKAHYEEAAKKLYASLKKDTRRYAEMLADDKISKQDFELLVNGRTAQLKIELLSELAMSKAKFEGIVGAVLKLTIKTVYDAV